MVYPPPPPPLPFMGEYLDEVLGGVVTVYGT